MELPKATAISEIFADTLKPLSIYAHGLIHILMQNVVVSCTGEGSKSLNKSLAALRLKPIMFDENLSVCVDWGEANTELEGGATIALLIGESIIARVSVF